MDDPVANPFLSLLTWYRKNRRPLPWRQSPDPYAILVSEIMLQQTRVETVIPYFQDFLQRFPNPDALARADLDSVYEAWAGLGYYRRARNLQRAALRVAELGRFPSQEAELLQLPGVGEYTAAALASIAFGQPALALDGNALRVLTRFYGLQTPADSAATKRELRRRVVEQIPQDHAGDFTQSIMELGATLCRRHNPHCGQCPLQKSCVALARGLTDEIPAPKRRRNRERVALVALRIWNDRRQVLLENRADTPFLAHQWMPPWFEASEMEAKISKYREHYAGSTPRPAGAVHHQVTYRDLTIQVWDWETKGQALEKSQEFRPWDPAVTRLPRLASKILTV